jgi:putative transcriptional regulator
MMEPEVRYAMTTKSKAKSQIFETVHETVSDLHRLGFIDKRKMRKFDVLCLDPIPAYDSEKIRALRDHLQLSQAVLASVLNTSISTVRKWELGDKHPSGPSLKLLNLLDRKGLEAVI